MKKRVGDIEEFAFDTLTPGRELHLTIAISGWVTQEGPQAFKEPWLSLLNSREQYCIRYESSYLLELGRAMDYFLSFAVSMAAQESTQVYYSKRTHCCNCMAGNTSDSGQCY